MGILPQQQQKVAPIIGHKAKALLIHWRTDGRTDGRMDGQTENLPLLQDFVPYRGRCPASPMKTKEKVEQGKGTADHLMPFGYLFERVYILSHFGGF